jgi:hypothetical protein
MMAGSRAAFYQIDKDRPNYTVYCAGRNVGRIEEGRPSRHSAIFWSMTVNGPMTRPVGFGTFL